MKKEEVKMNEKHAHLIIVTDCGGSDQPRYGIAVKRCFWPHRVVEDFFAVESMNTLHVGFTAAAHALSTVDHFGPLRGGENIGLLVNAAPRHGRENGQQLRGAERKTDGEEIYALKLNNGVWVVGPNAGHNFYFFTGQIEKSFLLTSREGLVTPFRSMEFMVPALAKVLGINDFPDIELSPKDLVVPTPEPGIYVGGWDSHGNMYVYDGLPDQDWVPPIGQAVPVKVGNKISRLRHVSGIFDGETGEQTLTQGSLMLAGKPVYYIVAIGGNAHALFGKPSVGTRIEIERD